LAVAIAKPKTEAELAGSSGKQNFAAELKSARVASCGVGFSLRSFYREQPIDIAA